MKGVFNLSSRALDPAALATLNLGMKFIPTPGHDTSEAVVDTQFDRFARNVRLKSHFGTDDTGDLTFHSKGSDWEPRNVPAVVTSFLTACKAALGACYMARSTVMQMQPVRNNMTPVMTRALHDVKADPSLVTKWSDKNMGLCVMDRVWYRATRSSLLGNSTTYKPIPAAAMSGIVGNLQSQVSTAINTYKQYMPSAVYKYLGNEAARMTPVVPHFYLLPKLHKLPVINRANLHLLKGRPIAACHSWVTNPMSVYMAHVLNDACFQLYPQVLRDSKSLVTLLESASVSRQAYLVTFDVENMYPSIDNRAAIDACAQAAHRCGTNGGMVTTMLDLIMLNGYCQAEGLYYQQISGTVMGTPVAPPYSNIYIAEALEAVVKANNSYWPVIYKRFIDDGFFVWEQDEPSLQAFLQQLNSTLPNIKLTWKYSQTTVDYMDLTITKTMHAAGAHVPIIVSTYQKPHNQYMYIPAFSFHRPCVFKGFVTAELQRYAVTNTQLSGFLHMKQLFMQRLLDRGYPAHKLQGWFDAVQHTCRQRILSQLPRNRQRQYQPPVLVLPNGQFEMTARIAVVLNRVYAQYSHHSEIAAIFGGAAGRITVAYTKNRSIGAKLVNAKH